MNLAGEASPTDDLQESSSPERHHRRAHAGKGGEHGTYKQWQYTKAASHDYRRAPAIVARAEETDMTSAILLSTSLILGMPGAVPISTQAEVSASLVCITKDAIRWRGPAWDAETCAAVAAAMTKTREPAVTLAIGVLESDLREKAMSAVGRPSPAKPRPGRHGKRFSRAQTVHSPDVRAVDVGLLGVRCLFVDKTGKCINRPARGLTVRNLQDPTTNIAVGAEVLESKRRTLGHRYLEGYNGSSDGADRYRTKVAAIVAALRGERTEVKWKRVRKLVDQISVAVNRDRAPQPWEMIARKRAPSNRAHCGDAKVAAAPQAR